MVVLCAVLGAGCARGIRGFAPGHDPNMPAVDSGMQPLPVVDSGFPPPVDGGTPPDPDSGALAMDAGTEPDPDAGTPPPTGTVSVVAVSGTVAAFKVNGDDWDVFGGTPDVSFDFDYGLDGNSPKRVTSPAVSSFTPQWNKVIATGLTEADLNLVGIAVWDEDGNDFPPSADDAVGACNFTVKPNMIGVGPLTFDCPRDESDPDQSGYSLTLEFRRN